MDLDGRGFNVPIDRHRTRKCCKNDCSADFTDTIIMIYKWFIYFSVLYRCIQYKSIGLVQ